VFIKTVSGYRQHQERATIMNTIKRYLTQSSTYKGLALLLSVAGITIAPGAVEAIGAAVVAVIGIVETLRDEK
jgi:hypothetical protein